MKKIFFFILFFCLGLSLSLSAQDSLQTVSDTTISLADSTQTTDSLKTRSDFKSIVDYKANDSMFLDLTTMEVTMYGQGQITYGDISLQADRIDLNWQTNILKGKGQENENGELVGTPIFNQEGTEYHVKEVKYNFKSKKAVVSEIRFSQEQGFIHGEQVKLDNEKEVSYLRNGLYTTCEADHPHFGIRASRIKMIGNRQLVTGPFQLEINDVETPLGFPFAMVPMPKTRTSGILIPSYGESRELGFFLRDGGYYWAISDYIDMTFLGEIYSRGGYGLSTRSTYSKRYHYAGNLQFRFNNRPQGEKGTPERVVTKDFWLSWSHNPVQRGASRFSASVNAGTSTANRNFSRNTQDYLATSFNSSITYSNKMPNTPFNFSSSIRHNQNVQTDVVNVSPQMSLNMTRLLPLKNVIKSRKSIYDPLKQLGFTYKFNARADITNAISPRNPSFNTLEPVVEADTIGFNFANAEILTKNAKVGGQHNVTIGTSATLFKYFNLSPSLNYTETWFKEKLDYNYVGEDIVDVDTLKGLQRAYSYSMSASLNTRIYLFSYPFFFKKKIVAIRHLITPSISFSYNPDFTDPNAFPFYQEVQVDAEGTTRNVSRFENGAFSAGLRGKAGTISFNLTDIVEMKVMKNQDPEDTKKIKLLESFTLGGSYNIAVDSFNLSNISIGARTKLFGLLSINASGQIDPYTYDLLSIDPETGAVNQVKTKHLAWHTGNGIGTLSQATIALNGSLNPNTFKKNNAGEAQEDAENTPAPTQDAYTESQYAHLNQYRNQYLDFSVPWSLSLGFNLSYRKTGFQESTFTQTLNFNGDLSLTEKWKITYRSGYDFKLKELSFTSIGIHRNLHCWQMSVDWVPFGPRQSYSFEIGVKAAILQDLKLNRRNNWYDRN